MRAHTQERREFVRLTPTLEEIVARSGWPKFDGQRDKRVIVKALGE
jgi:hypothetical protein